MNITIDGLNINYQDSAPDSQSPVVLILQGWGTSLHVYDSVTGCISEKYRVIQLDFPGFGQSDEPDEPWNVQRFSDFTIRFIEALQIQKATLFGHSYGGRVIINLASRDELPFEIEKIALVDSAGILPKRSFKQKRKVFAYKILKHLIAGKLMSALYPDLVEEWKSRQGSEDYRKATPIMRKCLVMAVNEDQTGLLPKIKNEVLLVWGDLDTATPLSDGQKMEELIPDAALCVIPGTGHYSFLENPSMFRGIIRAYLGLGEN